MKHRGTTAMMSRLRQPSQFPRIDMPPDFSGLPSPRFGRLDPAAPRPVPQFLSGIADIAKHAYPAILVLTVFLCFFLATAVVHLPIWAAAFRH
jgi:hypothetical protein